MELKMKQTAILAIAIAIHWILRIVIANQRLQWPIVANTKGGRCAKSGLNFSLITASGIELENSNPKKVR